MKTQFVPYDTALALKNIGFDEPCFTKFEQYFNKKSLYPILSTLFLNTPYENEYHGYDQKIINDEEKIWRFTGYKNSVKDHNEEILTAPLWQQVIEWFKDNHNIRIYEAYPVETWSVSEKIKENEFSHHGYKFDKNEAILKAIEIVKAKM